jgi:hypothetical protein
VSALPPGVLNVNATGRVSPVGNFSGIEESSEYFFGLGPQAEPPFYIAWTGMDITSFSSECPEVAASKAKITTSIVRPGHPDDGKYISTLVQTAFWRFDENGAVLAYDAVLPQVGKWFGKAYGVDFSDRATQIGAIDQLCQETMRECTGKNQQFESVEQCIVSHGQADFGVYDEIWGNNTVCRTIHVILAKLKPEIHCPHIGPSGGGKCVDIDYNEYYFDDEQLYGRLDSFVCPGTAIDGTTSNAISNGTIQGTPQWANVTAPLSGPRK